MGLSVSSGEFRFAGFAFCIVLAIVALISCGQSALAESYIGRVVGVTDGDTIKVMHNGVAVKIRLAEIDCPEKTQAFGMQAKKYTSQLSFDRDLRIVEVSHDRYGRTVALAYLPGGECLNEELVSNGYAWCYRKYCKRAEVLRLEDHARQEHLGLWSQPGPIEPALYRQQERLSHTQHLPRPSVHHFV